MHSGRTYEGEGSEEDEDDFSNIEQSNSKSINSPKNLEAVHAPSAHDSTEKNDACALDPSMPKILQGCIVPTLTRTMARLQELEKHQMELHHAILDSSAQSLCNEENDQMQRLLCEVPRYTTKCENLRSRTIALTSKLAAMKKITNSYQQELQKKHEASEREASDKSLWNVEYLIKASKQTKSANSSIN